jgi:hypothetical protein
MLGRRRLTNKAPFEKVTRRPNIPQPARDKLRQVKGLNFFCDSQFEVNFVIFREAGEVYNVFFKNKIINQNLHLKTKFGFLHKGLI